MGSILWDSLGGKLEHKSNRRNKKHTSGEVKRRKTGFKKRIMKVMYKAPDQFYTTKKMCDLLNVKSDQCIHVVVDIMQLTKDYKLVWAHNRKCFGLFERWIPLDKITENLLAVLAEGGKITFTKLWYGAISERAFNTWRFEFNMGKLVDDLVAARVISQGRNEDGGKVFYFTPEQFFEYSCRDARTSSNG